MTTLAPSSVANPLDSVTTHPGSRARTRQHISVVTEAGRRAGAYLATTRDRRVSPDANAVAALEQFRVPLPERGRDPHDVLRMLDNVGSPATMAQHTGRFFGWVNGGLDPAAHGAAILAGAWDQNLGVFQMSPTGAVLDEVAGQWVVDALGLPPQSVASFTSGATLANLTGVLTARHALYSRLGWDVDRNGLAGAPRLRVIVGEEAHASALKALRLAGFGSATIERVPTDRNGAIRADAFPQDTDAATLVLLQAGNVNTGHSDPFEDVIPGVRERGGWVHVDGAFGLWAAASPRLRHLVAGVEQADSWATDAHKWLNAPYDSGIVIVRDQSALVAAMSVDAPYLQHGEVAPAMNRGIQMSQRARGVETWAMLASHGREGLAGLIDRSVDHAQRAGRMLADAGARIPHEVVLNQVLVQWDSDEVTERVAATVQAEGVAWAGLTTWRGARAIRISVSDAATTAQDIDLLVDALGRAAAECAV